MGWLVGLLVARGWKEPVARWTLTAVLFLAILGALAGAWAMVKRDIIRDHDAKIEQRAKPATNQAATERARDIAQTTQSEQEMHNAIAAEPDQPIAPTSRALSCERLRKRGHAPAACR